MIDVRQFSLYLTIFVDYLVVCEKYLLKCFYFIVDYQVVCEKYFSRMPMLMVLVPLTSQSLLD